MNKNGLFLPANVVRTTVGTVAAVLVLIALNELPEARRYLRLRSM
ncbi:hypothetical protein [Streptomyces sp. S.PNR 29]|nr:hypothetical protein [Streptomyces sp. S.PNR 29]MDN0199199.1 hypothetical protein [Streptomyces sp. S.PNR 29]